MRGLELPQHLRFADDHALEAARDPEHVERGIAILEARDHVALDAAGTSRVEVAGEPRRHLGAEVVGADHVEIGAIAGREHCGAMQTGMAHQVAQGRCSARRWDGRCLPYSQWSGAKAQPGGNQSHHERV